MRVSLAWLREFVAFELSAEKLAERLTMAGLQVEAIEPYCTYEKMLVGRIQTPHELFGRRLNLLGCLPYGASGL